MMGERGRTTVVIGAKTRTSYWYAHARDAVAAEEDYLRTAGRVVGNRERPARTTRGARFESNIDRATRPRCKARTAASVGLTEVSGDGNARDVKRRCAVIAEHECLRWAGSAYNLVAESQDASRQSGIGTQSEPYATQGNRVWTAQSSVDNRDRCTAGTQLLRRERYGEAAVCSRSEARTATTGLAEVCSVDPSKPHAVDGDCRSAIVGDRLCLSSARGSDELWAEVQARCGRKTKSVRLCEDRNCIGLSGRLICRIRDFDGECNSLSRRVRRARNRGGVARVGDKLKIVRQLTNQRPVKRRNTATHLDGLSI